MSAFLLLYRYNSQVVEILPFYLPLPSSFSLFSLISFMRSINVTDEARRERIMPPKRSMASVWAVLRKCRSFSSCFVANLPSSLSDRLNNLIPSDIDNFLRSNCRCNSGGNTNDVKTTQNAPMKLITWTKLGTINAILAQKKHMPNRINIR